MFSSVSYHSTTNLQLYPTVDIFTPLRKITLIADQGSFPFSSFMHNIDVCPIACTSLHASRKRFSSKKFQKLTKNLPSSTGIPQVLAISTDARGYKRTLKGMWEQKNTLQGISFSVDRATKVTVWFHEKNPQAQTSAAQQQTKAIRKTKKFSKTCDVFSQQTKQIYQAKSLTAKEIEILKKMKLFAQIHLKAPKKTLIQDLYKAAVLGEDTRALHNQFRSLFDRSPKGNDFRMKESATAKEATASTSATQSTVQLEICQDLSNAGEVRTLVYENQIQCTQLLKCYLFRIQKEMPLEVRRKLFVRQFNILLAQATFLQEQDTSTFTHLPSFFMKMNKIRRFYLNFFYSTNKEDLEQLAREEENLKARGREIDKEYAALSIVPTREQFQLIRNQFLQLDHIRQLLGLNNHTYNIEIAPLLKEFRLLCETPPNRLCLYKRVAGSGKILYRVKEKLL